MKLLFVCSGNTCRSPLALAAWRKNLAQWPQLGEIEVSSAGLCPEEGALAAPHAQKIAESWGVDLSAHRARFFTLDDADSDLILTLTTDQALVLREHFGLCEARVRVLGSFASRDAKEDVRAELEPLWGEDETPFLNADDDILDPFGGSREAYADCAAQIERAVHELGKFLAQRASQSM